jgi:hypothetical protein
MKNIPENQVGKAVNRGFVSLPILGGRPAPISLKGQNNFSFWTTYGKSS